MLKDKDRIFQNLYNDKGSDVESSRERGDWTNTKDLIEKGRDWTLQEIIKKLKVSSTTLLNSLINIVGVDLYLLPHILLLSSGKYGVEIFQIFYISSLLIINQLK